MSEYDDLERQLRTRVRDLDPQPGRTRRFRGRRLLALIAVPVVLAGGTAAATGLVGGDPGVQDRAERLATRAVVRSFEDAPCTLSDHPAPMPGRPRLVDGPAPAKVLRVLPALAPGAPGRLSDAEIDAALPPGLTHGTIARSSVRQATFPGGGRVLVFVSYGSDFAPRDPAGCTARRKQRLLADRRAAGEPTNDATTTRALFLLDHHRDTDPRSPSLQVLAGDPGSGAYGGAGAPLEPGDELHPGLLASGSAGGGRKRFVGIAAPGATSVTVRAAPGSPHARPRGSAGEVRRDVPVQLGLFALTESRGAGHLVIEHRAADGRVLLRRRLQ
ncbi:hypothetical protein AB0L40_04140 [Patulibacter sp. NPDC049589]|uniref:hypothetical protein n=1 Tax=Patulibacter sp. NPDC049589 TaxID=3154731 RepID=UPI0034316094